MRNEEALVIQVAHFLALHEASMAALSNLNGETIMNDEARKLGVQVLASTIREKGSILSGKKTRFLEEVRVKLADGREVWRDVFEASGGNHRGMLFVIGVPITEKGHLKHVNILFGDA